MKPFLFIYVVSVTMLGATILALCVAQPYFLTIRLLASWTHYRAMRKDSVGKIYSADISAF